MIEACLTVAYVATLYFITQNRAYKASLASDTTGVLSAITHLQKTVMDSLHKLTLENIDRSTQLDAVQNKLDTIQSAVAEIPPVMVPHDPTPVLNEISTALAAHGQALQYMVDTVQRWEQQYGRKGA